MLTFISFFSWTILDGVFLGGEREDFGVHVEDVGHNLLVTLLLEASSVGHLESNPHQVVIHPPTPENPSLFRLRLDLAKSLDHLESIAFLVTKLDSFCGNLLRPWSGSIVLELGLARIF